MERRQFAKKYNHNLKFILVFVAEVSDCCCGTYSFGGSVQVRDKEKHHRIEPKFHVIVGKQAAVKYKQKIQTNTEIMFTAATE